MAATVAVDLPLLIIPRRVFAFVVCVCDMSPVTFSLDRPLDADMQVICIAWSPGWLAGCLLDDICILPFVQQLK